jgi:hypothetical protein
MFEEFKGANSIDPWYLKEEMHYNFFVVASQTNATIL